MMRETALSSLTLMVKQLKTEVKELVQGIMQSLKPIRIPSFLSLRVMWCGLPILHLTVNQRREVFLKALVFTTFPYKYTSTLCAFFRRADKTVTLHFTVYYDVVFTS